VNAAGRELVHRGLHALRRSGLWWGTAVAVFVVLNVAFWPSLRDSKALSGLEDMGALLEAFGAQDIGSPRGYLDGQLFALLLPVLLAAMSIAQVSAVTSGDEDAGRLELLHALPVSRTAVWLARWTAGTAVLAMVTAGIAALTLASMQVFALGEAGAGRVAAATLACGLLAAFHAAVAFAAGGLGASRGRAAGAAVFVLVAGYVVSVLLPLADSLAGARRWSPWYWALGEQPVSDGVRPLRLALVVGVTAVLVVIGLVGVNRRDIRSA